MSTFVRLRLSNVYFCLFIITALFSVKASSKSIDDSTCLMCHEDYDRTIISTKHRLSSNTTDAAIEITCTSCHGGAESHIEDPSPENITTITNQTSSEAIRVCSSCHKPHNELDNYGFDSHSLEQLNCSQCHKVHGANQSLLLDEKAEFCFRCHDEVAMDFRKRSSHPVMQRNITCLNCHRFAKRTDRNQTYDIAGTCRECHPEQGGPFPFEHEAINAYSLEGGSCIECHSPHGSENNKLLKQPGNELCRQCHLPSGHLTAHGGIWAKYACEQCHVDTHGSFSSNHLLDPDLPAKFSGDCFNIGCHNLSR